MSYQKADFAPLRERAYGIGFHWTTWTAPRSGEPLPFPEAVEAFPVEALVEQAVACGAGWVLFPATHAWHWIPGPNPEVDRIIAGRTCQRDLPLEIALALEAAGIKLAIYYNPVADAGPGEDEEWSEACGARAADPTRFYDNFRRVVGWMGEHYGPRVVAFWFDCGYSLEARPPTPWAQLTQAAQAGYPERLVCYNSGIENLHSYTPCQDYWAGELVGLDFRPPGPLTPAGLPWHSFVAWHRSSELPGCGQWGLDRQARERAWVAPPAEQVLTFLRGFQAVDGAVTFNLLVYQDGSVHEADLGVMREVRQAVR